MIHIKSILFLIIFGVMSLSAHAQHIKISFSDGPAKDFSLVDADIIKMFKTIDAMIADFGGYDQIAEQVIPLVVSKVAFTNIISVLEKAKLKFNKPLDEVPAEELEKNIAANLETYSANGLIEMIQTANFLSADVFLRAALKLWAQKHAKHYSLEQLEAIRKNLTADIVNILRQSILMSMSIEKYPISNITIPLNYAPFKVKILTYGPNNALVTITTASGMEGTDVYNKDGSLLFHMKAALVAVSSDGAFGVGNFPKYMDGHWKDNLKKISLEDGSILEEIGVPKWGLVQGGKIQDADLLRELKSAAVQIPALKYELSNNKPVVFTIDGVQVAVLEGDLLASAQISPGSVLVVTGKKEYGEYGIPQFIWLLSTENFIALKALRP